MITEVSRKITDAFIENNVIIEKQKDIYTYGMELMISTLISTFSILASGMILNRFWSTIFLLVPFYVIRVYAGGFHAETYTKCNVSFTVGFLVLLLGTEWIINKSFQDWVLALSFISGIMICIIAPVEDHSRPLNWEERKRYNKKARMSTMICMLLIQIIYHITYLPEVIYVASAINAVFLVLLAGMIKNWLTGYKSSGDFG